MFDSHAHIISRDTSSYPPIKCDPATIALIQDKAFDADDLLAQMDAEQIPRALLVQRGQFYGTDNSYICAAASEHSDRLRAVCGINARLSDCVSKATSWLDKGAIGLRLMGKMHENSLEWLASENAAGLWRLCAERQVTLCIHLFPSVREEGLMAVDDLLNKYSVPWVVFDHLSNPPTKSDGTVIFDAALARLADRPNVALKYTTIPLGRMAVEKIDATAMLQQFVASFGEDRLIWGSDITQSPGSYSDMVELARDAVAPLPAELREKLLRKNAQTIYGWV